MRISDWSSDVCSSDLNFDHRERFGLLVEFPDMIDPGHDARQAVWELADIAHRFLAHLVEQMLDKVGEKGRLALELFHQGAAAHAGALGDRERTRAGISRFVQADRKSTRPNSSQ